MKTLLLSYLSLLLLLAPLLSYGQNCSNQFTVTTGGVAVATVNNGQSGGTYDVCPTAGAQYSFEGESVSNAILTWYRVTGGVETVIATTTTPVTAGVILSINVNPTVATTYRFRSDARASCNNKDGSGDFTFTPSLTLTTSAASAAGICVGNAVTLTAGGSTTNTYAWMANGVTIQNQTGATLTQNPLVTTVYTVTATTSCGRSSQQVTIPVKDVTISPAAPVVCASTATSLTADYSGSSATYAWSIKGQSGTISPATTTATSATITVSPAATTTYQAVATTSDCGTITKEVTVTVSASPTTVGVAPASSTICTGTATTLTATSNYANATYAWSLNGNPIAGATGPTYTTSATVGGTSNTYSATATTPCGGTSSAAAATVSFASPTSAVSPASGAATVCSGSSTTLTASSNITNATYAWYTGPANGAINTGGIISTSAALTISPIVTATTTYPYRVVITACGGTSTRNVTVTASPSVSITPSDTRIASGNSTTLTASGATSYTWTYTDANGSTVNMAGTSATQTVSPTATTTYRATGSPAITATGNCSNIAQATVTVVGPLPVELVSFDARWAGGNILLAWATASETNSAYYAIERSLNGADFTSVGQVAAQGNKYTPTTYAYRDLTPMPKAGSYYYRLRQVDLDGKEAYSPVRTVTDAGTTSLSLYPNPSGLRTTLVGAVAGASVQVMDALGRVVFTNTADATGAATLTLPATAAKGLYLVRTGKQTIRLMVTE